MAHVVLIMAVLFSILLGAAVIVGRHLRRQNQPDSDGLSPVSRQHINLLQGGQLSETAVESAKDRFRTLLERGEVAGVEASLQPGTQYIIQVRALAELGTEDAGQILERQLHRRLSEDHVEQSWYWIDLASGLRSLNRSQSLPYLLRYAEKTEEVPLGHFFAAETVCFLGFAGYLRQSETPLGQAALRVLHRALEGLRLVISPQVVIEARLGELVETLWDCRPHPLDPLAVRVFQEAARLLRRRGYLERHLVNESGEHEACDWQMSRLAALEPALEDYLSEVPAQLCAMLPQASEAKQRDILQALIDLRAQVAETLLPLLEQPGWTNAELGMEALTWSRDSRVGPWLRLQALRQVPMDRRAQRVRVLPPRKPSLPRSVPYRAILRALRGHPSPESEAFLLLASQDWDPTYRTAAIGSLGWWEPMERAEVLLRLQQVRRDPNAEVRQAARAALARLGERHALQGFRHALNSEDSEQMHDTIQLIAQEGLTLLWPDLDRLADAADLTIAHHASEALECLCEDLDRRLV